MASPGLFDDLIPKSQGTGLFDDLIPHKQGPKNANGGEMPDVARFSRKPEKPEQYTSPEAKRILAAAKAGHKKSQAIREAREKAQTEASVNAPVTRDASGMMSGGLKVTLPPKEKAKRDVAQQEIDSRIPGFLGKLSDVIAGVSQATVPLPKPLHEIRRGAQDALNPLNAVGMLTSDNLGLDLVNSINPFNLTDPEKSLREKTGTAVGIAMAAAPFVKGVPKVLGKFTPEIALDEVLHGPKFDLSKPVDNVPRETPGAVVPDVATPVGSKTQVAPKAQVQKNAEQMAKSPEPPKTPVTPQQTSPKVIEQGKAASENTALFNRFQEAEGTAVKPAKGMKKGEATAKGQAIAKDLTDDAILTRSKEIAEGNRPHSAEEVGVMLEGKRRLLKTSNDLKAKLDANPGDPELVAQYAKVQGDLDTLVQNVQKGKGAWSDTGRALQEGVSVNTADFADVMAEYRRVGGKANPKLEAELSRSTTRIKELEDLIAARDAEREFKPAEQAVQQLTLKRNPSRTVEHIRTEKAETISRIKERIQQAANEAKGKASSDPTGFGQLSEFVKAVPDVARDLRRVVELVIEEHKATKLDKQFYDRAREELRQVVGDAEITDSEIRQVLSGRMEPKTAHTTSEATRRLNDLKKQAGLMEDIEGAKAGKVPQGKKLPAASAEVQRLRGQLNELLKTMGKGPKHEAVKTRLRGMIAELEGEFKGNYRLIKNGPKPKPLDVGNLRNEVATLRRKIGLDDEIARLQDQLRTGEFDVKGKTKRIYDKEETAQRAELDKLKNQVQARIKAAKPRTKGEKVESFLTGGALLNPVARIKDVASNTVKLASYSLEHPVRVVIGQIVNRKATIRGTEQLLVPAKLSRMFDGYATRVKNQIETTLKTGDVDSIAKYGTPNLGSKLAGATDIPFKEFYFRHALDDLAVEVARSEKLKGPALDARVRQIHLDPPSDLVEIAHEWALRQTFNIDNVAGKVGGSLKGGIKDLSKKMGPKGEAFGQVAGTILETPVRFSKVIGNVALDKFNRTPAGIAEAIIRARLTDSPAQARLVADLASKGLTGTALYFLAKNMNDAPEPELVKTKGGQYLDWGEWIDELGGATAPVLAGWSDRYIDKADLTDSQKNKLRWDNGVNLLANQPLVSGGIKQASRAMEGEGAAGKFAGGVIARSFIPSAIREWAKRQDAYRAGNILKERKVESTGPLSEIAKNLPFARETLPTASTVKAKPKTKKSHYRHIK